MDCWHHHHHYPSYNRCADGRRDEGAQEAEEAEEDWRMMCGHVHDLMDKRSDLQDEIYRLEQELKRMKEELAQLKDRKKRVGDLWSKSHTSIIIQGFRVVKGCFIWAKCTK